jgi:hypothetical protein
MCRKMLEIVFTVLHKLGKAATRSSHDTHHIWLGMCAVCAQHMHAGCLSRSQCGRLLHIGRLSRLQQLHAACSELGMPQSCPWQKQACSTQLKHTFESAGSHHVPVADFPGIPACLAAIFCDCFVQRNVAWWGWAIEAITGVACSSSSSMTDKHTQFGMCNGAPPLSLSHNCRRQVKLSPSAATTIHVWV